MSYRLKQTEAPATEPVSVAELKAHLRVDWADEDAQLAEWIKAAREVAESYTSRQFHAATWQLILPTFPDGGLMIGIPRLPLITVESLSYLDSNGDAAEIDPDDLNTVSADDSAIVSPGSALNYTWPSASPNGNVILEFTAGYAPAAVPSTVKAAIKLFCAAQYRNREAVSELPLKEVPLGFYALLDTLRNYSMGGV